jgi:nucleotide-binding universal stress UspA family protein
MRKVLVPISGAHGGGTQTQSALTEAISLYREEPVEVHLLNVQPTVPRYVAGFFKSADLQHIHQEAATEELATACATLNAAGVPYQTHIVVGRSAESIVRVAEQTGCDRILMGHAGQEGFAEKLFGTVASQVRHLVGVAGNCKVIGS